MATAEQSYLRSELEHRRERLESALSVSSGEASLTRLLGEVDAALARMNQGGYGLCEVCHDPIEPDRILADPLVRFCLDHLTTQEQRALESDLELVAKIQRGLLPPSELRLQDWEARFHYEPASLVSGDYCDLVQANGTLYFLLGDVAGKGVAASLLMSHLHATFRSLINVGLPLEQIVQAANRVFCESTFAGQYATLVFGRADSTGDVELVSAGHLPVFHLRTAGISQIDSTSVPLGMFSSGGFPSRRASLAPGEALFLFTDGLTESHSTSGEEFGLKRVSELARRCSSLPPSELLAECLAHVRDFSRGASPQDDLTLLVLRRSV